MDVMDETCDAPVVESQSLANGDGTTYRPRGYQLEMFEASRQQNIIVAVW